MRYLVNQITDYHSGQVEDAKAFKTIEDAFQFIRKSNKNTRILVEGQEATLDHLTVTLKERLATVTLTLENEPGRRYVITAF